MSSASATASVLPLTKDLAVQLSGPFPARRAAERKRESSSVAHPVLYPPAPEVEHSLALSNTLNSHIQAKDNTRIVSCAVIQKGSYANIRNKVDTVLSNTYILCKVSIS